MLSVSLYSGPCSHPEFSACVCTHQINTRGRARSFLWHERARLIWDWQLWMSEQSPPILSTSVLTEADPNPTPCLGVVRCSQPIHWLGDRQKRRKKKTNHGLLQFKCLTPKQETAEQPDIQAGGRMFCPWEVQLYFHCWQMPCLRQWPLCFPRNTAIASRSQRNAHSLGRLSDAPHSIIFSCLCWTVKGQSSSPGWKSLNPVQTALGVSCWSLALPLSLAFE